MTIITLYFYYHDSNNTVCDKYCTCGVIAHWQVLCNNNANKAESGLSEFSDCSVTEYLPLEKAKSLIWVFWGFPLHDGKGNTINMLVHLQYNHKSEYSEVALDESLDNCRQGKAQSPRLLNSSLQSLKVLQDGSCLLTRSVTAKDMLSFDCVNNPEFHHVLCTMNLTVFPWTRQLSLTSICLSFNTKKRQLP